jgi:hypothetical protein
LCQQATFRVARKDGLTGNILVVSNLRHHLSFMTALAQITSDDMLDSAYEWLCRRRRDYSANSDIWNFRRCWQREKEQIKGELLSGSYRFSLLTRVTLKDGEDISFTPQRWLVYLGRCFTPTPLKLCAWPPD